MFKSCNTDHVRKILHYFLAILIVIPSMVCAMPCRTGMNDMAEMAEISCDDHESSTEMHGQDNDADVAEFMLLIDCMNSDIGQAQNNIKFEEPVYSTYPVIDLWHYNDLLAQLKSPEVYGIRGPPSWARDRNFTPPLILTTQRFRI